VVGEFNTEENPHGILACYLDVLYVCSRQRTAVCRQRKECRFCIRGELTLSVARPLRCSARRWSSACCWPSTTATAPTRRTSCRTTSPSWSSSSSASSSRPSPGAGAPSAGSCPRACLTTSSRYPARRVAKVISLSATLLCSTSRVNLSYAHLEEIRCRVHAAA